MNANDCSQFSDRFSEYLDGELAAADRARIDAHVATCSSCRESLESLRETVEEVRRYGRVAVPPDFAAGVRQRIEESPRASRPFVRRVPLGPLALAASLLVVIALGLAYLQTSRHADLPPAGGDEFMVSRSAELEKAETPPLPAEKAAEPSPVKALGYVASRGKPAGQAGDAPAPVEELVMQRLVAVGYETGDAGITTSLVAGVAAEAGGASQSGKAAVDAISEGLARHKEQKDDESRLRAAAKTEAAPGPPVDEASDAAGNFTFVVVDGTGGADLDRLVGVLKGNGQILGSSHVQRPAPPIDTNAVLNDSVRRAGGGGEARIQRVSVYEFQSRTLPEGEIASQLEREFGAVQGSNLVAVVAEARRQQASGLDGFRQNARKLGAGETDAKSKSEDLALQKLDEPQERLGRSRAPAAATPSPASDAQKQQAVALPRLVVLYRHPLDEK
ncbi:MAG: zf-HC2 domain-containing protein [Planctomycetes bacterium]|nr:zf-HC2 domain-containing protein [Planctomycetota bacterium]MBI3847293.1 zf-HC2 domain-containing protein [Planctomycetota bacterium]